MKNKTVRMLGITLLIVGLFVCLKVNQLPTNNNLNLIEANSSDNPRPIGFINIDFN